MINNTIVKNKETKNMNIANAENFAKNDAPVEVVEDKVNHPAHYQSSAGIECIQVIETITDALKGMEAVCVANVIKYLWRWKAKNGIEDLKKAQWYLAKLIEKAV